MRIDIAPIALSHIESFHACLDSVARERKYLALTAAPPIDQLRQFVRGGIESGVARFVATEQSRVVGWCDISPGWPDALCHCGTLGMGVLPEHRKRGIGRRLIQACLQRAQANGLSRIELEVRCDNDIALRLYAALGFEREGTKRAAFCVEGRYFDVALLSRLSPLIIHRDRNSRFQP